MRITPFILPLSIGLIAQPLLADSGIMGGWAADPADCAYVSDREGVTQNVTAGIITPDNVFYHGGECHFTGIFPGPNGRMTFRGVCDEGDGPFDEQLDTYQTGPDQMRAAWGGSGWTTYHRCWDLPPDWQARVNAARNN
jgi:hypothetical protein